MRAKYTADSAVSGISASPSIHSDGASAASNAIPDEAPTPYTMPRPTRPSMSPNAPATTATPARASAQISARTATGT